ncbi:MAG: copper chaperone PCu(A)C [Caldilineae bacterium]|nr:MAG: copper chaperone PCu(A)C [Caldilineae bacterium]
MGRRISVFALLLVVLAACGSRGLTVSEAWARSSPANAKMGVLYFTIRNAGGQDDALTGIETTVAQKVELHRSVHEGDAMKMEPVPGGRVTVPAGETVRFEPGGLHGMLVGLQTPLRAGDTFDITLHFEHAGAMTVQVEVRE